MFNIDIKRIIHTSFVAAAAKLLSFYKLSFVVGSQAIFFSASNLSMPLVGAFGGAALTTVIWALILGLRFAAGSFSLATLAFYIPGYCAALYLATQSRMLKCGIPLLCMVLFVINPVGMQAAIYSAYWLIPLMIGATAQRSFFMQAVGATFTAHAVGSVIWLYTMPTTPALWFGLIPIVAVERLTFAAGMVVLHTVLQKLIAAASSVCAKKDSIHAFLNR